MPNRHVIKETIAVYANAILDGAYADGGRERVVAIRNQMIEILGFMATNIDLRYSCDDEEFTPEQREQIVNNVFGAYDPKLVRLLSIMAAHCDVAKLRGVYHEYEDLIESKLNFNVIDVTTVVDLDDNLRTVITQKAESDMGRDCVLVEHIDPSIQGGIIMSTRGRYVDASVRSQFNKARLVLKETTDGGEC
jgi:F-type H+-transporting ATPase subunit delta